MIEPLERTLLGSKDLKEQTPAEYLLIVDAGSRAAYYYIDSWEHDGKTIEFRKGDETIYACRLTEGRWAVIHSSLTELLTNEDLIHAEKREHEALAELHKKMHPDHDHAVEGKKPLPTGQYV